MRARRSIDYAQFLSQDRFGVEDLQAAWGVVGTEVRGARRALRPEVSIREASRRAGFSDATWRKLESGGFTQHGHWVPPNLTNKNLEAAAVVVGLDPRHVFGLVGREYDGPYAEAATERPSGSRAALSGKIERLNEEDRLAVESIVDRLLGEEP
jgi:hypothetical protein